MVNKYKSGLQDKDVQEALQLIEDNADVHEEHEAIWRVIQDLFKLQFSVSDPSGTRVVSSKLLLQILWKTVNKMKIPDFKIHKAGPFAMSVDKEKVKKDAMNRDLTERIVTAAVSTVMEEGGFIRCMRDKGGVFFKTALFGDAHLHIGFDEDKSDYPIAFRVGSLSDYYVNTQATDLRDAVGGNSADGDFLIFRYTMKQFNQLWPKFKDNVPPGTIPRSTASTKQLEKTWSQTVKDDDVIEVAYATSISKVQVVFAGPACVVLRKYDGDPKEGAKYTYEDDSDRTAFPYVMDGKPYLPTLHFKFFPSSEGYYNYGIGHMLYDIALLAAKMDNMAYRHAVDNVYPINFVNSPSKGASKLFNQILKAQEMRDAGGSAYVVSENPGGGSGVSVEPFQSQPITTEWERAFSRLEQQITRMGFRLDVPDLGASPNEMSIMAEQESTDAPIKQVIEYNASEFKMAVDVTMDFIRKFISDDDETPLNSRAEIQTQGMSMPLRGIPLGWVAKELRKNKYFVEVNSRDGTVPSGVMEEAKLSRTQATLVPGSPAWNKINLRRARLHGVELTEEDLGMAPQAPQQGTGKPGAPEGGPIATETSPLNAATLKHPPKGA